MQPFLSADQVKDAYWRYITTSFPIRDAALRAHFAGLARDEKLLWQEPFVALARPFCSDGTFAVLVGCAAAGLAVGGGERGGGVDGWAGGCLY